MDRRPAVIARCLGPADVASAFAFARAHALEVAVRGGGHNPAGHCVCDDGLVIDLTQRRAVEVDEHARLARAQGGATWLDFDAATQGFGLVTPGGVVGSTGVAGLTMGGGIGHLTAQYGLTCDSLVGAELALAEVGCRTDGDRWTLVFVRLFRHPPEKVWAALTDPAQVGEWAPFTADHDLGSVSPRSQPGWHLCLDVAERLLDGQPVEPIRGNDAKNYGWDDLHEAYAEELEIAAAG